MLLPFIIMHKNSTMKSVTSPSLPVTLKEQQQQVAGQFSPQPVINAKCDYCPDRQKSLHVSFVKNIKITKPS